LAVIARKLWVTGANGMLGRHVVAAALNRGHDVAETNHGACAIEDVAQVHRVAEAVRPDVIINCAGRIPGSDPLEMVAANTLGPHVLASLGIRLVQMSTDCVFSGIDIGTTMLPDPNDLYGRTKLAGEPQQDHVVAVRGSFIGREGGFLHWLMHAEGRVQGWANAKWNGTSVPIMAGKLLDLAIGRRTGVVHAGSPGPVTKLWMVEMFVSELGLPLKVVPVQEPRINRVLSMDGNLPPVRSALVEYARSLKCVPA
jgi:dTDP-4-dehydrorhamnose reductase